MRHFLTFFLAFVCFVDSLFGQQAAYKLYGINFSPYLDGQSPDARTPVPEQQIRDRLAIVKPYTDWIRTFGTEDGLERVCSVARESGNNLKVAVGAWVSNDLAANERQLANLIQIARTCVVDLAIVGSEVLLRGNLTEAQLLAYINRFKQQVPTIPVTTADTYSVLLAHPNIVGAVSVVMANYYPYWEGQSIDSAVCVVDAAHRSLQQAAGNKRVIVSEAGWPSAGDAIGNAVASPANASRFFREFVSWARANSVDYFYFEAFDESWKTINEGPQGAYWGVWDKLGNLKPDRQPVFDGLTVPVACGLPGGPGTPALEFTYVPVYGAGNATLRGTALHVSPSAFAIAVYILVRGNWWTKPFANQPTTPINAIGEWATNVNTGGVDYEATQLAAFLIPTSVSPPVLLGESSLPQSLYSSAVATRAVTRTGASVSGRIVDAGGIGLGGITAKLVNLSDLSTLTTLTTPAGLYSFPNLTSGSYTVTPFSGRLTFLPPSRSVMVSGAVGADFVADPLPEAPSNPSPVDRSTGVSPSTLLAWNAAARAGSYDVYLGTTQSPLIVSSGPVTSTSFHPGPLQPSTTYWWKIGARNQSGVTFSPVWSFSTAAGGSAAPTILAPAPGQVVSAARSSFQWTQVPGVAGYRLTVTDQLRNTVFLGTLAGAASVSTSMALPNGSYVFQIRGCAGGLADPNCGASSSVPFIVSQVAPTDAPWIFSPIPNSTLRTSTHELKWSTVSAAPATSRYQVQIWDAQANKQELSISSIQPSTIFSFHSSTWYEMRVRACSVACGPWSPVVPFAVDLPAIPTAAPTVGSAAISSGNQLTASWSTVPNADLYILQVVQLNTGPGGGALTVASVRTAAPTYPLTVPAGPAVVIVKGCNGNGCGPDSTPVAISVPGPNSDRPVIGYPISGTIVDGPIVLFSWSRTPGDNGSNTPYRLWALDFTRDATAFDIQTTQNFWAGYFLTEGNRYDAVAFANINTGGPPVVVQVRGTTSPAPTPAAPRHQSTVRQGNITVGWTPVPGATLYEYFIAIPGQPNPIANGVTPGLDVQVPLFALNNAATQYSGIMRACPAGATCRFGSDAGWGPWSGVGPGVTNFTVVP